MRRSAGGNTTRIVGSEARTCTSSGPRSCTCLMPWPIGTTSAISTTSKRRHARKARYAATTPRGNIRGRSPYREGPQCSQCPSVDRCVNGLCEPIRDPEEAQDLPSLVTEASFSLASVASEAGKQGVPSSLATESPSFLVTEVPASLATRAQPTLEIEAPSSLASKYPPSMATEAPSLLTTEVPSFLASHSLFSLDERPITFPKSTHTPTPKLADKMASSARAPSVSPETLLHPEMSLTGIQDPFPQGQEKAKTRGPHTLPPSGEVLASVFAAQDEPDELQATLAHMGHTSSRSLPSSPNTSATTTLQSPLPDEVIPEDPDSDLGIEPVIEPEIESGIPSVMGKPNNGMPSNIKPTTEKPTMVNPTTVKPTTVKPTTVKTTTERMTTTKATTITTTMEKTTTVKPTTVKPTTVKPTTVKTTTEEMTTEEMTIEELTMEKMTTETMTTEKTTRVKLNNLKANKVKPTKVKPRKPNSAPDHVWSPFLGLLLLPPLVLAGTF
ncbi:peptidase inhibitor 16-like isoform X3 [Choloepus didactylus]|uniref:peptidase inhibitor 16-like isoform X3 n=1 Tax=Choloepus didactylus TaxID=27675 RepID=UPI0018A09C38|nr:peptidase inhibitor 16-like isoform X3 [Choloepus didactylus]